MPISSDPALAAAEQWQPGDLVLAADGALWCRADPDDVAQGWPWGYPHDQVTHRCHPPPEGSVAEQTPVRPLTLLVRDGQRVPTAPHAEELTILRSLRRVAERLEEHSLMLFLPNATPDKVTHLGYRVEVPIESWDDLMDVLGDLRRYDLDHEEREGQC